MQRLQCKKDRHEEIMRDNAAARLEIALIELESLGLVEIAPAWKRGVDG